MFCNENNLGGHSSLQNCTPLTFYQVTRYFLTDLSTKKFCQSLTFFNAHSLAIPDRKRNRKKPKPINIYKTYMQVQKSHQPLEVKFIVAIIRFL